MNDSRGLDLQGTCYKCDQMGPLKSRVIWPHGNPVIFGQCYWGPHVTPLITGYFGAHFAGLRGWWFLFCLSWACWIRGCIPTRWAPTNCKWSYNPIVGPIGIPINQPVQWIVTSVLITGQVGVVKMATFGTFWVTRIGVVDMAMLR